VPRENGCSRPAAPPPPLIPRPRCHPLRPSSPLSCPPPIHPPEGGKAEGRTEGEGGGGGEREEGRGEGGEGEGAGRGERGGGEGERGDGGEGGGGERGGVRGERGEGRGEKGEGRSALGGCGAYNALRVEGMVHTMHVTYQLWFEHTFAWTVFDHVATLEHLYRRAALPWKVSKVFFCTLFG